MLLCVVAAGRAASADDEPSTTPYRPSVSTPAALSAPGWLEVEAGLDHARDGSVRRDSVPTTLKLAFTPDWGIRISADSWVRQRDQSTRTSGIGDTGIVLKRRFAIDDAEAFGLEAQATVPTARRGLGSGSGKADYGLNAIYSADFAVGWHTDLNLIGTRLGQIDPAASRMQWLWAASLSQAFDDRWSVGGELSGTHQRGADNSSQFLVAVSYNVSKRLTLDVGAARGLRSGPPSWSVFTGLTWLAAKLF